MNRYNVIYSFVIFSILLSCPVSMRAGLNRSKVKKGIKAYEQSQFDQSLQHFQDAVLDDPENPLGHYNVAEALYKNKKYEEALKSYEKALSAQDLPLKEKTFYNLGNTHYQMNKYQEAIQSYIKALELDPNDQDAKHNLELVRAKLKEMAQKQPGQNQQQQQQNQQGEQQKQDQQNQEGSENQQNQQNQKSEQEKQQQEQQMAQERKTKDQQGEQQQAKQLEKKKDLSKEEAERILQALRSDEKENQKLRRPQKSARRRKVEKDW